MQPPWPVYPLTAIHYSLLPVRVIIFSSDPTATPRHGSYTVFALLPGSRIPRHHHTLCIPGFSTPPRYPGKHYNAVRLWILYTTWWIFPRTLHRLVPSTYFLAPVFAPPSRPLSFLSFLLVSTSEQGTAKIRAYVNVRNLVLIKLRICTCLHVYLHVSASGWKKILN